VVPLVGVAIVLMLFDAAAGWRFTGESPQEAAADLGALLEQLDEKAASAAASWGTRVLEDATRAAAFEDLERRVEADEPADDPQTPTWFLFDPNGEAVAWAGPGLLHEVSGPMLPRSGRLHLGSFTASTFLSIAPLEEKRRPWRVVVGVSLPTDRLPGSSSTGGQWAVVGPDVESVEGMDIAAAQGVRLAVRGPSGGGSVEVPRGGTGWAGLLLAAGLALAAVERFSSTTRFDVGTLLLAISSGAAALVSCSLEPWLLVPFLAGVGLALSPGSRSSKSRRGRAVDAFLAFAFAAVLLAGCVFLQGTTETLDLGRSIGGDAERTGMRLALFTFVLGCLRAVRGGPGAGFDARRVGRLALVSILLLLLAASVHGWTGAGLLSLFGGAGLAVSWARRGGWAERGMGPVTGCVLAALIAAVSWELVYHRTLEDRLREAVEERLAPPANGEIELVALEADAFFASQPLEELTVGDPAALDPRDLAFALWRRSPLVRAGRVSSVTVREPESALSSFAYGLPSPGSRFVEGEVDSWFDPTLPGWEHASIAGSGELTLGGGRWARVDYEILLRPGFREGGSLLPTLAAGLLQSRSDGWPLDREIAEGAYLGLYDDSGEVIIPPWHEASALPFDVVPPQVSTPTGRARTFVARDVSTIRVGFLPVPSPLTGLERVTTHAAGPLLLVFCLGMLRFALSLGDVGRVRQLLSGWRSFSKRLVLLYTVLLVIPILVVNVLVLRAFAERLDREQRAAGRAALESVQSILGDYVFSLEPGFGIDTAVGDDVLLWLSGVVDHDVNLYWGSLLTASSKRELFSSGLLPQRIPGDIFSRIALGGSALATRTTRAGGAAYKEFYAPLEAPGGTTEDAGLFISTPLLAQEVAAAEEMGAVRRRMFLTGSIVALLLALLGRQVARSLTRPLLQIVEGTQAIAAGATSISIEVTDSEFVTLVEAIDEMAGRIAAARSELMREKALVDRMIDNITSGVISVDRDGRAQLLNRTARTLLGISVGDSIADALSRDGRLTPVLEFLEGAGEEGRQRTVRIAGDESEEKEWTLLWVPLEGSGDPKALFVLEDVTEVLRGQRLQAWAEMARMIAHEVKNPLTPIRLSTEHLREVQRTRKADLDVALERCTDNILRQVDELQQIVSDFSAYSRIPASDPKRGNLADLVESVVEGYRAGGPRVTFERVDGPWIADFDEKLLSRAVRNLLENAVRATRDGGEVRITVRGRGPEIEIRVEDSGSGIPAAHLPRIFEPYFSTEDSGTGLGLPIAKRIVEEHGGTIAARNNSPRGLEVVVTLPRQPATEGEPGTDCGPPGRGGVR
jgi:signal transduction histidine kinase